MAFAGGGTLGGSGVGALVTVDLETVFGDINNPVTDIWAGLVNECTFVRAYKPHNNRGIHNLRTLNSQTMVSQQRRVRLGGEVDCGVPLAMALGGISGTTDPTLNVFKGVEDTQTKNYLPSWTVHRTYDEATDDSVNMLGVTWERGDFNIDLDGPFTYVLNGVGKSEGTTAANSETSPATALGSWNTTIKVKEGAAAYTTGTTIDGLNNFGFTINNRLFIRPAWGSAPAAIRQPVPLIAELELRLTRGFIDDDFWDDLCDGTVQSFQAAVTDGTTSLTLEFDSCFCEEVSHTTNLDGQSDEVAKFNVKTMDCVVADSITYIAWA